MGFEMPWRKKNTNEEPNAQEKHDKETADTLKTGALIGLAAAGAVAATHQEIPDLPHAQHAMPGTIASAPEVSPDVDGAQISKWNGTDAPTVTINAAPVSEQAPTEHDIREGEAGTDHEHLEISEEELAQERVVVEMENPEPIIVDKVEM